MHRTHPALLPGAVAFRAAYVLLRFVHARLSRSLPARRPEVGQAGKQQLKVDIILPGPGNIPEGAPVAQTALGPRFAPAYPDTHAQG